jgi:acetyl-CoA carboxylase biotin carboxyl carrier protein
MKSSRDKKTTKSASVPVPGVDIAQLEKLLDFMAAHGLEEFEYEHQGLHIRLKKASGAVEAPARPQSASKKSAAPSAPAAAPSAKAAPLAEPTAEAPAAAPAEDLHIIKSPIVGTFYGSPSPEAPSFVNEGDNIRSGQVVCIVEAMKLMNEIEADVAGEVVRVLVENKQPVEYGQPLFSIRPGKKK